MKTVVLVAMALFIALPQSNAEEFVDEFRNAKLEGSLAERSVWKFENGVAGCVADLVLYKKYKNHGPILKWPREFDAATIKPKSMPGLPAVNGKWVQVRLEVTGRQAKLTIGDFQTEVTHAALARDKNMVMLTFAHGEPAVWNFRMMSLVNTP